MKVKNLNNSSKLFPKPSCSCNSWISHWDINKYPKKEKWAGWCRGCGKSFSHSELCGGHVIKVGSIDKSRYIIPLCSSCNAKEDAIFEVKEEDLVTANCDFCINY